MQKLIRLTLSAIFVLTLFVTVVSFPESYAATSYTTTMSNISSKLPFSDIATCWAKDYIIGIYEAGLTDGFGDGTYRPSYPVTRAEMAAFIDKALRIPVPKHCTSQPFSDVPVGVWFCRFVEAAKKAGKINGFSDGTYKPYKTLTRGEVAAFLAKALNLKIPNKCTSQPFLDVPVDTSWCPYIEALKEAGIIEGFSDGTYKPNKQVDRAQVAAFLYKAFVGETPPGSYTKITNFEQAKKAASAGATSVITSLDSTDISDQILMPAVNVYYIPYKSYSSNLIEYLYKSQSLIAAIINKLSLNNISKFKRSTIPTLSGTKQCSDGGSYSYNGSCDQTTDACIYNFNFNACEEDNFLTNGSTTINVSFHDNSVNIKATTNDLDIIYYNNQNTEAYTFSAQNFIINMKTISLIGSLTKTVQITGSATVDNKINGFIYKVNYDNISYTMTTPVIIKNNQPDITLITNGRLTETINNTHTVYISYDKLKATITNDSDVDFGSIDGKITVQYLPDGFCKGANGTYIFKTIKPIKYNEATGMDTEGEISINNALIQWNQDGTVSVYIDGKKINTVSEDELIDENLCLSDAFNDDNSQN